MYFIFDSNSTPLFAHAFFILFFLLNSISLLYKSINQHRQYKYQYKLNTDDNLFSKMFCAFTIYPPAVSFSKMPADCQA